MFVRRMPLPLSRVLLFSLCLGTLATIFAGSALAQPMNKKTTLTFSQPIEIPGVGAQVLPAGTYVFRLLDSMSDRNIVQVLNKDETHVYATILAIPNYRLKVTDKTVMTFRERAAGAPNAIRAWFYPGANWGQEFVYPKARALELAKATNEPVLYLPSELEKEIVAPVTTASEPPVLALKAAPLKAISPKGEEVAVTEVVTPPPASAATVRVARLPKTAGEDVLVGLLGAMSMGLALTLRRLCSR